jgi:hypothetical protein
MLRLAFRILTFVLFVATCASVTAQEADVTAKLHPWGRFEPGTWKLVRIVSETLNEQGQVVSTSTTDTKTTLVDIDANSVTLDIDSCVEVAGKRFQAEPQTIKQGFHGESAGPSPKLKEPTDGEVVIEDRKIPCRIQEVTVDGPNGKTTITLHYSMTVSPYVLKRTSVTLDPDGKSIANETDTEAIVLEMPARVQNEIRNGSYVKTVHKNGKATVTTLAVVLPDVPGGVVSQSSKEVDKNGVLVRRSTLEVLDYNADPDKDHSMFGRKRSSRRTKQPTRHGT